MSRSKDLEQIFSRLSDDEIRILLAAMDCMEENADQSEDFESFYSNFKDGIERIYLSLTKISDR